MSLEVACEGVLLTSLQNVFSTGVGVAFAYPILSQIIDIKNEKILAECARVLKFTERIHGKAGLSDLGNEKLQFQFELNRIGIMNGRLTFASAIIGFVAFLLLVISSIVPTICIARSTSVWSCLIFTSPFLLGIVQLIRWYDGYARLSSAISYYRENFKAKARH
ncbi:hypothetical protein ASE04_24810 [Rhizobium sp. Root708]|nr:hypothetical protein ASE04_24810 [Rhizobium sp. Root708]